MKLHQIVRLKESEASTKDLANVAAWLTANNYNSTSITATANPDGTINVAGDLELGSKGYPSHFPAIKHFEGNFACGTDDQPNTRFPETISGNFKIWAKDTDRLKSSMVPKCTGNGEVEFSDQKGNATLELDDISAVNTYSEVSLAVYVVSGLEKAAQIKNLVTLSIKDNLDGIPPHLKLATFMIKVNDGQSLKGLGKKLKSVEADYFQINMNTPGPLMALFKPSYKFSHLVLNVEHNLRKGIDMSNFMKELKSKDLDVFEAQEAMIDAGYTEYARQ